MINVESLRRRVGTLMTTPPEILFALTRHWIVVLACLAGGTLLMASKVLVNVGVYEGRATLLLNPADGIVVEQPMTARARGGGGRWLDQQFFKSRVDILTSDTVLRRVVQVISPTAIFLQDEDPERENYDVVRRSLHGAQDIFSGLLAYLQQPRTQDFGEDAVAQRGVAAFRRRCAAVPEVDAGSIELRVSGYDRARLESELQTWIEVYIERLVEMGKEASDAFIASRMQYWQDREEDARRALEAFQAEYPAVSKTAQDLMLQEIMQLQLVRLDVQRASSTLRDLELTLSRNSPEDILRLLDHGSRPATRVEVRPEPTRERERETTEDDARLRSLRSQQAALLSEVLELRSKHPISSDVVQRKLETLQMVELQIERLRLSIAAGETRSMDEVEETPEEAVDEVEPEPTLDDGPQATANLDELADTFRALRAEEEQKLRERIGRLREQEKLDREQKIADLTVAIDGAMRRYSDLSTNLGELESLRADLTQAEDTRKRYDLMRLEEVDRAESRKNVEVQVSDPPHVSWTPYNTSPYGKIGKGAFAGLAFGVFLALALETLRRTIRFKNDIESQFRLPVVGVFSKG